MGCGFFIPMRLTVNGDSIEVTDVNTVQGLLDHLKVQQGRVAVEVNLAIVKKADYAAFGLKDGDAVEIVNFVGGG